MFKKLLLKTAVLSCLSVFFFTLCQAQSATPEDGKVYRFLNASDSNKAINEDFSSHNLYCGSKGDNTRYDQLWKLAAKGNGFSIQNVYTGYYVQTQPSATYQVFTTGTTPVTYYIRVNQTNSKCYDISSNVNSNWVMHCQADNAVVGWYPTANASQWTLEEVAVSDEEIELARLAYAENAETMGKADEIKASITTFFDDDACTQLKSAYSAMSDDELRAAMSEMPTTLQDMAVKIKNNSWGKREQEFRIREYEPYSDADTWARVINTKVYSYLDNPTGIYGKAGSLMYVFVDADTPADATLKIMGVDGTNVSGSKNTLTKGLNIIMVSKDKAAQFILYTVNTRGEKVIADFPNIKIHIEGGTVNGFFDKKVHTDADWVDITRNLATSDVIQVKGEKMIFHMSLQYITASNCCPNKITDAIGWWDNMAGWQQSLMGFDDVYPSKYNNHLCAISLTSGYQSATDYRTQYTQDYIRNLLPLANVLSNADNAWGPAHENGHVHQYAINMVGCSEVSNNLFSNYTIYKLGKFMSRGAAISTTTEAYNNKKPWIFQDGWAKMRMYWQLLLYYHLAGKNPDFYPTLFQLMRETPLARKTYNTGMEDQLLFAEKCCEAAGEDLTSFFEAWGFFIPTNNAYVGDYGSYYLTVKQSEIDEAKAFMAKYKKAAPIEFIEDRIKYEARTDGVSGNKVTNDMAVGKCGDVGHYTDFKSDTVKASGYIYLRVGTDITISGGTGAVGFRVYDGEGNLVSFSNKYAFSISEDAISNDIKVVAVQANNEEVVITTATEGTEEQQLAALNAALATAKEYIDLTNAGGVKVGYFYSEATEALSVVYNDASAAKKSSDQTLHTYGEWCNLINDEIELLLKNDNSKITIKERNYYSITNASYTAYGLYLSGTNLACGTSTAIKNSDTRKKWEFIPAGGEGMYYIRNKGGNYITTLQQSTTGKAASSSQSDAIKYKVVDNGDGTFYMKGQDDDGQCLHCDGSKNLVGWNSSSTASHWYITITENRSEAYELAALDSLVNVATGLLDEITDTTLTTEEHIVILSNIYPNDTETFADNVQALLVARNAGAAAYGNKKEYSTEIANLESCIAAVQGKYNIMPVMPMASSESEVTWYYIKSLSKEMYCTIDTVSTRYLNNIPLADLSRDDKSFWWCFIPTGNENEFYIYNYKTAADVYSTSNGYLKCDGATLGIAYTISLVEDKFGFSVTNGEYSWNATTYAKIAKLATYWTFEKIVTEQSDRLTGIQKTENDRLDDNVYYDMCGRKTLNPTKKGLYIHNGKKIYIK